METFVSVAAIYLDHYLCRSPQRVYKKHPTMWRKKKSVCYRERRGTWICSESSHIGIIKMKTITYTHTHIYLHIYVRLAARLETRYVHVCSVSFFLFFFYIYYVCDSTGNTQFEIEWYAAAKNRGEANEYALFCEREKEKNNVTCCCLVLSSAYVGCLLFSPVNRVFFFFELGICFCKEKAKKKKRSCLCVCVCLCVKRELLVTAQPSTTKKKPHKQQ